jgi:hypothetical protein
MRTLVPRNSLFAASLRDVAGSIEGWQFPVMDPIEHPPDALDCMKRLTEQRPLAKLRCIESRPHDRLIEPLYDSGKGLNQPIRGRLCFLARGMRAACGDSRATASDINPAPESRE